MLNNIFNDLPKGFRLEEVEILNWGTFDEKIHKVKIGSENSLLTGDVGCGKSTIIDAITSLLVPPRKIKFNKAAGANDGERSTLTYFNGYYTSKQDESGKARSIGLRKGGKHISVILARFRSEAMDQTLTLSQVVWQKPGESNVTKFFILAKDSLSIIKDFSNFGNQINDLRKKLRSNESIEIYDNFTKYAKEFTKLMGLGTNFKALELFNKTISMKAIGSVTQFVRDNMLEKPDIEAEKNKLEASYEDLKRLYNSVVTAKDKIELLKPIVELGNKEEEVREKISEYNQAREMLDGYIASIKLQLITHQSKNKQLLLDESKGKMIDVDNEIELGENQINGLEREIIDQGGSRLNELEKEITSKGSEKQTKKKIANTYTLMCSSLSLPDELSRSQFKENIEYAKSTLESSMSEIDGIEEEKYEQRGNIDSAELKQNNLESELREIHSRNTNINARLLQLRKKLCEEANVDESQLPFIGELIKVKEGEQEWRGAIERVMHNFALSILVPSDLYNVVSKFVNNTHLGQRLVYYKVDHNVQFDDFSSDSKVLFNKLDIKSNSLFENWVEREVFKRFNYTCCESMEDFKRLDRAVTKNGQLKSGKGRHEKDDRNNINDKSRYVLGWDNKEKLRILQREITETSVIIQQGISKLKSINSKIAEFRKNQSSLQNLANFTWEFDNCDWKTISIEINILEMELKELSESSDVIKTLNDQLKVTKDVFIKNKKIRDSLLAEKTELETLIKMFSQEIIEQNKILETSSDDEQKKYFSIIEDNLKDKFSELNKNLTNLPKIKSKLSKHFNDLVQHRREREKKYTENRQNKTTHFANKYPDASYNVDNNLHSLSEFNSMLDKLMEEDLPRHEAKFKEMFERDTIRSMAMFQSKLDNWNQDIEDRVAVLNGVLKHLDYDMNPDTYIQMTVVKTNNDEIRRFKEEVRQCVENLTGNDLYNEDKFLGIEKIINRMREDEKWFNDVVDVRNWHFFNAVEYYRADDIEKECYSDSGGKSGGQKEKLAYLCLASAIILQYGLVDENGEKVKNKRKFNLIIIDEAFIRGSKESTRFGLELFKSLGLQLIVVTPLMKLDVISEYVANVHYIDKHNDRSRITNMPIETYRKNLEIQMKIDEAKDESEQDLQYEQDEQETAA